MKRRLLDTVMVSGAVLAISTCPATAVAQAANPMQPDGQLPEGVANGQDAPPAAPAGTTPTTRTPARTPAQTPPQGTSPGTGTRQSDPNAVLGGTTTFPKGQKPPVTLVVQGPLSEWDGLYAEAMVGTFNTRSASSGATARLGFQTRRLVGFEAEYSAGLSDFDVGLRADPMAVVPEGMRPVPNSFRTAEVASVVAGFVRARFPLDDRIGIFARVGYHQTTIDFTDDLLERDADGELVVEDGRLFLSGVLEESSEDFSGLATGLGAEVSVTESIGARLEFSRYEVGSGLTLNYLSIGGQLRF